jgi:hypothetical protein
MKTVHTLKLRHVFLRYNITVYENLLHRVIQARNVDF